MAFKHFFRLRHKQRGTLKYSGKSTNDLQKIFIVKGKTLNNLNISHCSLPFESFSSEEAIQVFLSEQKNKGNVIDLTTVICQEA